MEYSEVKEQIKQKLPIRKEVGDFENLLEPGLSSIMIMRMVNRWRKQGAKVAFGTLMEHPTLREWWEIIQKSMRKKGKKTKAKKQEIIPERDMREPFPLTDVQYAYWVAERMDSPLEASVAMLIWNLTEAVWMPHAWKQRGTSCRTTIPCCAPASRKTVCRKLRTGHFLKN